MSSPSKQDATLRGKLEKIKNKVSPKGMVFGEAKPKKREAKLATDLAVDRAKGKGKGR